MSAGRVILIVLGSIGVLLGLALLAGGGFLLWADRTQREDGYLTTPTERFATPTYALTRTRLEVDTDGAGWILNDSWFGKVRIRGESAGGKTLFMGIGPEAAVARYLEPVAHANVEDIDFDPFRVTYLPVTGGTPQGPPTEQRFWAASASGVGTADADLEGARGRLVGRPHERRRLAWGRRQHRPRRQDVFPALGRGRRCSSAACSSPGEVPHWSSLPRGRAGRSLRRRYLLPRAADQEMRRLPSLPTGQQNRPRLAERAAMWSTVKAARPAPRAA